MRCHAAILVAAICIASMGLGAQGRSRQAKSNTRPLVEQIQPTDEHLRLEAPCCPPLVLQGEPGKRLEMWTDISDAVLIIRVERMTPELTERRNWIESLIAARVERVVKPTSRRSLSQGDRITFSTSGGIMQIGPTTVEAVLPWAIQYEVGKRYLVFANVGEGGRILIGPEGSYEDVSGLSMSRRLVRKPEPAEIEEIERLGVEGAAAQIEANLQSIR